MSSSSINDMEVDEDGSGGGPLSEPNSSLNDSSSGVAKYSRSRGRPSNTNVLNARSKLNNALRSVVTERAIFEIFLGFNKQNACAVDETFLKGLFTSDEIKTLDFWSEPPTEGLLSQPAKKYTNETKITKAMTDVLRDFVETEACSDDQQRTLVESEGIKVLAEARLNSKEPDKQGSEPRLDITVALGDRLLSFVEVGLIKEAAADSTISMNIDQLFWHKVDQLINYLSRLNEGIKGGTEDGNRAIKVDDTVLCSVIVFEKKEKRIARMAIFCAQPKDKDCSDFRVSMMWRKEYYDINGIDKAYTAFVRAFLHLANRKKDNDSKWRYLGPACARVTTLDGESRHVLRAYDNRVRSTPRSPSVYKLQNFNRMECTQVIKVEDGDGKSKTDVLPFGELLEPAKNQRLSMLFYDDSVPKRGQIEVIAVPFVCGSHGFETIDQAIEVVTFLEELHNLGYVHGDIRGFNLVASNQEGGSKPIDFDFGGKIGAVKYPPGYVQEPGDGYRPGKQGKLITQKDDVQSLVSVLWSYHTLEPYIGLLNRWLGDCTVRRSEEREKIARSLDTLDSDAKKYLEFETMKEVRNALEEFKGAIDLLRGCMKNEGMEEHDFQITLNANPQNYSNRIQSKDGQKVGLSTEETKDHSTQTESLSVLHKTPKAGTPWGAQCTPFAPVENSRRKKQKTKTTLGRSDMENHTPPGMK